MAASAGQWNGISGAAWRMIWKYKNFIGPVQSGLYLQSTAPPGFGGAPGVTDLRYSGSRITAGNIYLNSTYTWNTVGTMSSSTKRADVRTIAIHEMGHQVYLNHPSSCGSMTSAEVAASMNPNWTKKWYTNSDDKAGTAARK